MTALVQRLRREEKLLVLCGATFIVMAGQGIVSPVLSLYAAEFGVGTTMVGLTVTMFAVGRLLMNIPAGLIADRYGRRAILVGGPIITAIGMIGSGLADSIWTLLAWRLFAGCGSALYMSGAMVYLIDIARPDQLSRYVATNQWALSLGVALGPGIGGVVADRWGLNAPFLVVGCTALLAALYAVIRLPETLDREGMQQAREAAEEAEPQVAADGSNAPRTARDLALSRPFLLLAVASMTIFMVRAGVRGTLMPLRAAGDIGWGPREIGLVFTLTGALTLFTLMPAGRAADSIGRRWVILFSGVVAGAGALVVAGSATATAYVVGNIIMSFGTGTAGPAPAAFVADITPPHLRGVLVGMYRSAGDVGVIVGPVFLGWLSDATSIAFAMQVGAVMCAAAAIAFFVGNARHPAAGPQPAVRPG
ncbi:MAG: MFS transporter [Actinomycetota bacterium]